MVCSGCIAVSLLHRNHGVPAHSYKEFTNVSGKIPGADKLDTAELCINLKDQKLYSKDADGNVFEIAGGKVESGPTPPSNGNEIGDLWWDGDFLLVWNGSEWVAVGASDLDYVAAPDKGTITNPNGR